MSATMRSHRCSLDYARFAAGVYSSWGQDSKEDGISVMLRETNATGTPVKWTTTFNERGANIAAESVSGQGQHLDVLAGL